MTTVDRLNYIQAEWMALDSTGPEKERRRVLELMKEYPYSYITVSPDKALGNVFIGGMPVFSQGNPMRVILSYAKEHGIRTDLAWCGNTGAWVAL